MTGACSGTMPRCCVVTGARRKRSSNRNESSRSPQTMPTPGSRWPPHIELGRFLRAVQTYSHAFQIEPNRLIAGNINREYGMALVGNGEEKKRQQFFPIFWEIQPIARTDLRSLALLDLYHGRYSAAQSRFRKLYKSTRMIISFLRRPATLLAGGGGGRPGNRRMRLQQLDDAAADLKDMGPKVEWGSIVGQEYVRAGALAKAAKLEKFITPLADTHDNEQEGYVHLLHGAIAAEKGDDREGSCGTDTRHRSRVWFLRERSRYRNPSAYLPNIRQSRSSHRLG